jgi:hypothetical protein
MNFGRALLLPLLALALLFSTGCVERKFLVVSNPSGAAVLINNVPLNTYTPADGSFLYTGDYNITIIADNYERLDVRQPVPAKWYEYPGLDFIFENLVPWTIHDDRVFGPYNLKPLLIPTAEDVAQRAELLRVRAQGLGTGGGPQAPLPPPGAIAPPPPAPIAPVPLPPVPPPGAAPPAGATLPPP